jgi:hypothetical protein
VAASDDLAVLTRQVADVIRKQIETGIDCVGDGEYDRTRDRAEALTK